MESIDEVLNNPQGSKHSFSLGENPFGYSEMHKLNLFRKLDRLMHKGVFRGLELKDLLNLLYSESGEDVKLVDSIIEEKEKLVSEVYDKLLDKLTERDLSQKGILIVRKEYRKYPTETIRKRLDLAGAIDNFSRNGVITLEHRQGLEKIIIDSESPNDWELVGSILENYKDNGIGI